MKQEEILAQKVSSGLSILKLLIVFTLVLVPVIFMYFTVGNAWPKVEEKAEAPSEIYVPEPKLAKAPSAWRMEKDENAELLEYGKELIANTAYYIGFNGIKKHSTNGLNCQNCHLEAGAKAWGNNYLSVASTYPKIRKRSGKMTDVYDRINGCLQRSLNGTPMDSTEYEMKAMAAYIQWLGQDVPRGKTAEGSKIYPLEFMDRAADPVKGKAIYEAKCVSCHMADGQGILAENSRSYTYPPLWGKHSYNDGAGLYRISKFAGYVKMNMPFGVSHQNPQLSDEEAWDLAAFVDSMPRPEKDKSKDWPKIADKPIDHPFGPYADPFSEEQHKYGPFKPIQEWYAGNP
ncbi:c-type cytochrome [Jiulongibacter sediminis]|uniref:Cytochrome C n=1 Tax=Jiulongibacter sediminis TaxID=1605367 RepID=A0A0P7C5N4_9BACT|nr:c-type cytochrome [Jiulongibacter sediminis]KPM50125.1 cytochrome C [Jiulongibacter sediminis]